MTHRGFQSVAISFLLLFTAVAADAVTFPTSQARINTSQGFLDLTVEVATTPEQMEQGFMHRTLIPDRHGILFLFARPMPVSFWMKDTPHSLDILFIGTDGTISKIVTDAKPDSKDLIPSDGAVKAVIELSNGSVGKFHIAKGDSVIADGLTQ